MCKVHPPHPFGFPFVVQALAGRAIDRVTALSNVEKYAASRGVARVSLSRGSDTENHWVILQVADAGPGIPPGSGEEIFGLFTRLEDSLHSGIQGAGLGLALAREMARALGGDLRLAPALVGACFILRLPLADT